MSQFEQIGAKVVRYQGFGRAHAGILLQVTQQHVLLWRMALTKINVLGGDVDTIALGPRWMPCGTIQSSVSESLRQSEFMLVQLQWTLRNKARPTAYHRDCVIDIRPQTPSTIVMLHGG